MFFAGIGQQQARNRIVVPTYDSDAIYSSSSSGNDGSGDGTILSPYASLATAIANIAGSQIILRGGTYKQTEYTLSNSGTSGSPVQIIGYAGETAMIDASETLTWTLTDAGKNIYTSVETTTDGNWVGQWWDGAAFQSLIYYQDQADFESTIYTVSASARYVGPGVWWDGSKIRIRTTPVPTSVLGGQATSVVFNPSSTDVRLSTEDATLNITGDYVELQNIATIGAAYGIEVAASCSNLLINASKTYNSTAGVLTRSGSQDITITNNEFNATFPTWLAWTDIKGTDGQSTPADHSVQRTTGINAEGTDGLTIDGNYFKRCLDAGVFTTVDNATFTNNTGTSLDDLVQIKTDCNQITIASNVMSGAGPSHHGAGAPTSPGTKYIHSNALTDTDFLWGKVETDPSSPILRDDYSGVRGCIAFSSHNTGNDGNGDPWKLYNNTMLGYRTVGKSKGMGYALWNATNSTGVSHEVYNNIFEVLDAGYHDADIDTTNSQQAYENNSYTGATVGAVSLFREDSPAGSDYATLAAWQAATSTWDITSTTTVGGSVTTIPGGWPGASAINTAATRGA